MVNLTVDRQLTGSCGQPVDVAGANGDPGTLVEERSGDREADALASSGDDDPLAGEIQIHRCNLAIGSDPRVPNSDAAGSYACEHEAVISLSELMERVDRAFERASAKPGPWPDPHPDRSPTDVEYSRVTNPEKWRIVGARADASLDALHDTGVATIERDVAITWVEKPATETTRSDLARPQVTGGLPLIVSRSRIGTVDDAGVTTGVGDPTVVHTWIPDCGCDACDSGSQDALDELDGQSSQTPRAGASSPDRASWR